MSMTSWCTMNTISLTFILLSFFLEQKKGKKGKKGKKEKDLTPDRSMHASHVMLPFLTAEFNINDRCSPPTEP